MVRQAKLLWVNDGLVPIGEATLDPRDRGFTLGDGLFETIRVRGGRPLLVEVHLADAAAPTLLRENDKAPALYVLMPMRV